MVKKYVRRLLNTHTASSYISSEDVIEYKWLKLCLIAEKCFVFLPEATRFLISNSVLFPLQEDFFWWSCQTGGGRITKRPDGDSSRTQQCHTDKNPWEQSMMGQGKPQPNPKHFATAASTEKHRRSFDFQCPYLHIENNTHPSIG